MCLTASSRKHSALLGPETQPVHVLPTGSQEKKVCPVKVSKGN